jgi:predicted house-cleaning noncanonical NTP pyrophosphatase (MazG superfamily)
VERWNKLVRGPIPEIIETDGAVAVTRTLSTDEFRAALLEKLQEEATELSGVSPEEIAEG